MIPSRKSTKKYHIMSVNVPSVSSTVQFIKIWSGFAQFYLRKNRHYEPMNIHSRNDLAARHIELDKIESHCPGPKMRNQDEGRRGLCFFAVLDIVSTFNRNFIRSQYRRTLCKKLKISFASSKIIFKVVLVLWDFDFFSLTLFCFKDERNHKLMLFKFNERNIHVSLDDLVYENNVAENLNHI